MKAYQNKEMKIYLHESDHTTKMAACHNRYYENIWKKFSWINGLIAMKLDM